MVRRIVGYRRLEGLDVAAALSRLNATTRLYVSFFQPSFKLASKRRVGARASRCHHAPATLVGTWYVASELRSWTLQTDTAVGSK